jgi:hypothetical protein
MVSQKELLTQLDDVIAATRSVLEAPADSTKEKLLIDRLTENWPFRVDSGEDEAVKAGVDDARSAAQMVRLNRMKTTSEFQAHVYDLLTALERLRSTVAGTVNANGDR